MMLMLKLRDVLINFFNMIKNGVVKLCKSLYRRMYTKIYCQKAIVRAKRGFGMNKKIRKEN